MATVEVTFTPLPVHVRTARLVATAVARRSGVAESLLDEVRLAVGEACSRAVEAHQQHCPGVPVRVSLADDGEQFQVVVTDAVQGPVRDLPVGDSLPAGIGAEGGDGASVGGNLAVPSGLSAPLRLPDDVGLAVIAGLADDVRIAADGQGTSVTMIWKRRTAVY